MVFLDGFLSPSPLSLSLSLTLSLSFSPTELQILINEMTQQVNVSRELEKQNKLGNITKAKIPPVLVPRLVCEAWVFSLVEMFAY